MIATYLHISIDLAEHLLEHKPSPGGIPNFDVGFFGERSFKRVENATRKEIEI
jgi:hypothetical protein